MTTPVYSDPIPFPQAWRGADLENGKESIAVDLSAEERAALDAVMAQIFAQGLTLDDIELAHVDLPPLRALMGRVRAELLKRSGIVLLRGLPMERHDFEGIGMLFWGLGCHLGQGVSQSVMGDRLGHVVDVSGKDPNQRAYRNSLELTLHTDTSDIVAMCCLSQAPRGGESLFGSALAVHNEMRARHPDLLAALYEGFHYHRFGEEGPGEAPITPYRVPHFSCLEDQVSLRYVREYIELAADESGEPLSDRQLAALDCFDAIARRPDINLEFALQPGEAIFLNNLTVMHARRAFWDGAAPAEKRHLLRLWLNVPGGRPTVPEINMHQGTQGGIARRDDRTTYYRGQGRQPALEALNPEGGESNTKGHR